MASPLLAAVPRRAVFGAGLSAFGAAGPTALAQGAEAAAGHVVLLGDSVFDNAGYLAGRGPDVAGHLRARLPAGWRAMLLARGGAVAADVPGQLARLPPGATHLAVSPAATTLAGGRACSPSRRAAWPPGPVLRSVSDGWPIATCAGSRSR